MHFQTKICWYFSFEVHICTLLGKLVVLGFNATLTAKVISWQSVTHMCFLAFSHQYQHNFFPKPPTTFFTCFCRGERQKYAEKKSRLSQGSNSQPPGHESNMLTTEPCGQGCLERKRTTCNCQHFLPFPLNISLILLPLVFKCTTVC